MDTPNVSFAGPRDALWRRRRLSRRRRALDLLVVVLDIRAHLRQYSRGEPLHGAADHSHTSVVHGRGTPDPWRIPVRSLGPSGVAVGSTTCGHLPKIVARRVRWRLPPPPPSPADARTSGSLQVGPRFPRWIRRFQRSRAWRRGGESRLGRGSGRGPGDRLASRVRWSGLGRRSSRWPGSTPTWRVSGGGSLLPSPDDVPAR